MRKLKGCIQQRGNSFRIRFYVNGEPQWETCKTREEAEGKLAGYLQGGITPPAPTAYQKARKESVGVGMPGVYFLYSLDTKLIKIGRSSDVFKRLRALSSQSSARLTVAAFFPCSNHVQAETWLHTYFAAARKHGEWFDFDLKDIEWGLRAWILNSSDTDALKYALTEAASREQLEAQGLVFA